MKIEQTYKQLWLVDDEGRKHNIAELLLKLIDKPKPKKKVTKKKVEDK
jgi:hypothetical protein